MGVLRVCNTTHLVRSFPSQGMLQRPLAPTTTPCTHKTLQVIPGCLQLLLSSPQKNFCSPLPSRTFNETTHRTTLRKPQCLHPLGLFPLHAQLGTHRLPSMTLANAGFPLPSLLHSPPIHTNQCQFNIKITIMTTLRRNNTNNIFGHKKKENTLNVNASCNSGLLLLPKLLV